MLMSLKATTSYRSKKHGSSEGEACTVIAWGTMVHVAEQAIKDSGVDCELIDFKRSCHGTATPWSIQSRKQADASSSMKPQRQVDLVQK